MKLQRGRIDRRDKASSALVITLLVVVLLTIIVVAFMQTMTLSLTTSKSYVDMRRATFAAQAGLDTAIAQISAASGPNLAFVTGMTNCVTANGLTNFPITLIGSGNLTNLDQVMPLVSGNISYLTNFGVAGFGAANFASYIAPLFSNYPTNTVDVNTPYQFIQVTSSTNAYLASWVTLTNTVGSQTSYTRYAYVVLDDTARVNPLLMTGAGTGYTNSTNWFTGPQDINITTITNSAGGQLVSSSQLQLMTNATSSNTFGYSDATLGEDYSSRGAFETNKIFLTSRMNPSFDVIPAWYPNGGMPKYNINDLATNPAYGATAMARALNIATIITNNLPNFYTRDPALTAAPDTSQFLYVSRLAANIVDYISPDGTWPASEYATNSSGISPQGHGVYPIIIAERDYVVAGAGSGGAASTTSKLVSQFWLSIWNPYTTPVTIKSANLHISNRPPYSLGTAPPTNAIADYTNGVSMISGAASVGTETGPPLANPAYVVNPNEFVVMGFAPQTNTIGGTSTTSGPVSVSQTNNYLPQLAPSYLEQYALTINGQTTAQSGAQNWNAPMNATNTSGGLQYCGTGTGVNNEWNGNTFEFFGTEAADPRFLSYYNHVWFTHGSDQDTYLGLTWKGVQVASGSRWWSDIFPPPVPANPLWVTGITVSLWANRDNIARPPANPGNVTGVYPAGNYVTPDTVTSAYNQATDSNAAPCVIRNGPMVSIGELGHVDDPANANDALTQFAPRTDNTGFTNIYVNGGGRSLRIGRPEENGNLTTNGAGIGTGGGATANSWDTNGLRAINLLDLFTVNNTNTTSATGGATNTSVINLNMNNGGALGRINVNTASTNVLAALLSGIQITSDSGMTNAAGAVINPFLTNIPTMVNQLITNRPYSSLSDLYKTMPMFDTNINYYPNPTVTASIPYPGWSDGGYANSVGNGNVNDPYLMYPSTLNVFNRVHQEAFGKLVQHLTVQSRSYRIYVIGQVLDSSQNPHGSVAMEVGVYLQYNPSELKYNPTIQYVRILK